MRPWLPVVAALCLVACGPRSTPAPDPAAVHARLLTLDTHLDTPLRLTRPGFDIAARNDVTRDGSQVDLPRLREGGLKAGFFAIFIAQGRQDAAGLAQAQRQADRIYERIMATLERLPDQMGLAVDPGDAARLAAEGRFAVYLGIENGHVLGGEPGRVALWRERGVRYLGLVHSAHNELGDGSLDESPPLHGGLSELGRAVVAELNRCGVMVDVSHASDATTRDALAVSAAPVIASHSAARAVFDSPRNLPDELIRGIAASGGVVQVLAMTPYLRAPDPAPERDAAFAALRARVPRPQDLPEAERTAYWQEFGMLSARYPVTPATLADVADHIDHIVRLVGVEHVGIGLDFDGGGGVSGLEDVSRLPNLTAELLRRGYSEDELARIWGGNLLRVLAATDAVAARLGPCGSAGPPA